MTAPCNCSDLAAEYKRACQVEDRYIGRTGLNSPQLFKERDDAWIRYQHARENCPHRNTYPHY